MDRKNKKLRPREVKFLEEYAQTGNHAEAFIKAGFRAKNNESARVSAYALLRKLDDKMEYREILDAVGLSDRRVAEAIKALVEHPDPRVQAQGVAIAARVKGWMADRIEAPRGAQILIVQQGGSVAAAEADGGTSPKVQLKPVALTK